MGEFTNMLGIETIKAVDGESELDLPIDERHTSRAQRVHGGVFFTLLDTAMGRAVLSNLPDGRGCATIEAKINYFRPVQHGHLRALGKCVYMSRRTAYAEGELIDSEGRVVAKGTGTFMLTDTIRQADRERV